MTKRRRAALFLKRGLTAAERSHVGDRLKSRHSLTRGARAARPKQGDEDGFTLIEIVIAISLLVLVMIPFSSGFISSIGATAGAHDREVATMLADTAIGQAKALDATDQSNGCVLLAGRTASAVQSEWSSPAPGTASLLAETAQASATSQTCTSSGVTPLPTSAQTQSVSDHTYDTYYYVGTCWETENTSSTNTCTNVTNPPSTDYEMYRVVVAVTWTAPNSGCGTSGCDYVASTLISATANPTFDVNPTLPYIDSATSTTFTIYTAGSFQFTTTGFPPPTYSDTAYKGCTPGTLPSGISLSSTGLLSGTPPAGSAGSGTQATYTVCVVATNSDGTGNQSFTLTVVKIPTSIGSAVNNSTSASVTYGTAAALSVSGLPSGTTGATGTVTFSSGSTTLCTVTLPATTCNTSATLVPGTYPVTATYPGDSAYIGSTSSGASLTVNQVPTSMSISVNPTTINYGSTATLAESGLPSAATGTVTFSSGTTTLCTATLPAKTCTTSASLAGGSYTATASYSGNTIYAATTSTNTVALTVDQPATFTSASSATFTVGTAGSFQVTASGYPTPTISNTTSTGCTNLPSGITFSSATGALSGTPATGTAGTYTVCFTATNSLGSTMQQLTLTINGIATSMSISISPATVSYGSTATLSESGLPSAATGTVTFASGATTLCTATLPAKTCSTSTTLTPGTYSNVTGSYSGNTTYAGTTSTNTVSLTVNKVVTSMSITVSPATITYGSVATLSESGLPSAATGTVTFASGATTLCTATLPATSCTTSTTLTPGTYTSVTGTYSGNTTYASTTATNTVSLTVNKATPAVSVSGNLSGRNLTFTATVSGPGATPTGNVTWSTSKGTCSPGTATLSAGSASCTISNASNQSYTATATYNNDTNYNSASGTSQPVQG
jgi:Bacterial Ig-like domain (group 3)/Putative Ig domain